jgi:hypothetical protein
MFQESEIITLLMGLMGLVIFLRFFKDSDFPGLKYIKAGCAMMVCAYIFTIVEGLVFESFFNLLEHVGYAAAGLLFALGFREISITQTDSRIAEGHEK